MTTRSEVEQARTDVLAVRWDGVRGKTDQLVVAAMLEQASTRGFLGVEMPYRQLAQLVGISKNTAAAALRRLSDEGEWLTVEHPGDPAHPTTYRVLTGRRERVSSEQVA